MRPEQNPEAHLEMNRKLNLSCSMQLELTLKSARKKYLLWRINQIK